MDCVVAHPRSGTNLLAELLNLGGEPIAAHEHLARLSPLGVSLPTLYYEGMAQRETVMRLLDLYGRDAVRIDSNWKLAWILGPFLERFPEARVLHLVRDPAETIRSGSALDYYGALRHHRDFAGDHARNFWLSWMPRVRRDDWGSLSPFERNCAFWAESQRLIREALAGHPRVMRVSLEELARDAEAAQRVLSFFGAPPATAAKLAELLGRRVNQRGEMKARVAAHRSVEWDAARLSEICGREAAALGYAP
jgi:hypothetical protein